LFYYKIDYLDSCQDMFRAMLTEPSLPIRYTGEVRTENIKTRTAIRRSA
jgi:hypothetical protein